MTEQPSLTPEPAERDSATTAPGDGAADDTIAVLDTEDENPGFPPEGDESGDEDVPHGAPLT